MIKVKDFVGMEKIVPCDKCGKTLYGDNGYLLTNGKYVCVAGDKCSLRVTNQQRPVDYKPRWRK